MLGTKKLKNRILELERELKDRDAQINELDSCLKNYIGEIKEMQAIFDSTPNDCIRGEWCKGCEFVKEYYIPGLYRLGYGLTDHTVYICGKGESCPNYIQKSKGEN